MNSLCKFGTFDLTPYLEEDGYDVTPNRRTDVDSYQDAQSGVLHRNTLNHTRTTISLKIVPMFENAHKAFMASLKANYIKYNERDAQVIYYDTENGTEKTGHMYIDSNQKFGTVSRIHNGQARFTGFTLELTEY